MDSPGSRTAARRRRGGFTLIELLVVMAIIATLAGLGMVGIPAIIRASEQTAAKDRLTSIYKLLTTYRITHKKWPKRPGALFPLSLYEGGTIDKTPKDCEIFFDPSLGATALEDLSNVTEEGINWTGPSFENNLRYSASMRNANKYVIVCNKVPPVNSDDDLDFLPHAAKGIVYLTAGGNADFMVSEQWAEGYPVVGPESSLEMFQPMMPYDSVGDTN